MNSSVTSDETEKIWDHPWTTDEIRQYRGDWNLAGDVGLLRHLQQFSENLTASVKNTQTTLDLLNNQLDETTILIDNVTNASLALANTQFIESRVYEDDGDNAVQQDNSTETDKKEIPNTEIITETDMIAIVKENIEQGIAIMDKKYERLEVVSSDSEDENEISQPSFILRPKDPYQNRPLPYIIGSEKWKASNKIGLESSSSESEAVDDDDDDDDDDDGGDDEDEIGSDKDMDELSQHILIENSRRISILRRSSSSSSESSDSNEKSITNKQYSGASSHTDKLYTRSQDTLNSTSEITTPITGFTRGGENLIRDTPSFAEELAKRLGSVMPIKKTIVEKHDTNQSSVNRQLKNDSSVKYNYETDVNNDDKNGCIFGDKSTNLFSDGDGDDGGLFDNNSQVSSSLWKDKPLKRTQTNIIPPSIDVPPPLHSTETKKFSPIGDLFADDDSDNSDDIFAPRSSNKSAIKSIDTVDVNKNSAATSNIFDKLSNKISERSTNQITSSTPETNNVPNLFEDDENDGNLFGSPQKSTSSKPLPASSENTQKRRPPNVLVGQSALLSSSLGSRLFKRQQSSDSSGNESENNAPDANSSKDNTTTPNEISNTVSASISSIREAGSQVHVETSDSSGISIHPPSIDSTLSLGGTINWNPRMESTRLTSEELYRERITSDSLLNSKLRQQVSNNFETTATNNNQSSIRTNQSTNIHEENLFDDDDVFSPPPLPKNISKSGSKVKSLFDDSDSGDDLFSNTSSGSRSQKSADILTNLNQQQHSVEKSKSGQKQGGLFSEGVDIFANNNASAVVDISTSGSTSKDDSQSSKQSPKSSSNTSKASNVNSENISKKLSKHLPEPKSDISTSIFDDSEPEDDDLFSSIIHSKSVVNKFNDGNNFFATSSVNSTNRDEVTVPKKDFTTNVEVVGDKESKINSEKYKHENEQTLTTSKISNIHSVYAPENKLFENSDDADDDSLFSQKQSVLPEIKAQQNSSFIMKNSSDEKVSSVSESEETQNNLMESSNAPDDFNENCPKDEVEDEKIAVLDDIKISKTNENMEDSSSEIHSKKKPPKSLKIRLPIVSAADDTNIPPRRAVSGKIKDLMGKMGDLKILSPTDTPLPWRRSSENPTSDDDNDNNTPDRDSEDGSSISVPSTKSLPSFPKGEVGENKLPRSPSIEAETAVSFDIPAQADTLTVTASKSRVRIPVKRRPQSRHARQSALRISGIDFDTVDTITESFTDVTDSIDTLRSDSKIERLVISNDGSDGDGDTSLIRPVKPTLNIMSDDKSELSLGKESSVSITKNTLLSPSTDEEDLFDVPPDLPEDPQKEDSLFGRAPILSPIQRQQQDDTRNHRSSKLENVEDETNSKSVIEKNSSTSEKLIEKKTECNNEEELIDPLRDERHDPLKNPSQLFAFVTKTLSPEKSQSSFNEDESLFSQTVNRVDNDTEPVKKLSFDIFANDSSSDLFSGPFTKTTTKKPTIGTKSNLFNDIDSDDDDATDDLFGSASSKRSNQSKSEQSDIDTNEVSNTSGNSPKQIDVFDDDDDDDDLFFDASEKPSLETGRDDQILLASSKVKKTKLEDIFGDQSGGEDDIFAIKKPIGSGVAAEGLFFDDDNLDDTGDIFAQKKSSSSSVLSESVESRVPIKKAATRDLRKTAEKIVKDPLSMLHDD